MDFRGAGRPAYRQAGLNLSPLARLPLWIRHFHGFLSREKRYLHFSANVGIGNYVLKKIEEYEKKNSVVYRGFIDPETGNRK
jgi:hypothetical protein